MVNCVSILGSTGSIGRQSLDIISRMKGVRVAALTAGTNVDRMLEQCREFQPELAVMASSIVFTYVYTVEQTTLY